MLYVDILIRMENTKTLKKSWGDKLFLYQHLSNERIHIYGNPEEIIRDYIYIDDLVEITIQLAQLNQLKSCVYNIGVAKVFL